MKRKIVDPNSHPQKVKIDPINKMVEDSASDEECQIVFIRPSSAPAVDASFESLEANNNTEEVCDEIDVSVLCLEEEPESQSVLEISSEPMTSDEVGRAIGNDRKRKADVDQKSPRKRASLQSFPIRKRFKSGPSKFEKKYDARLKSIIQERKGKSILDLDNFLCARDKLRRKDELKTTYVDEDEEISFKFKFRDRKLGKLQDSEEVTGKKETSQSRIAIVDLTLDEVKESPLVHNSFVTASLPDSSEALHLLKPQHNQVRNGTSPNQQIASSTLDGHQKSLVNNQKDESPGDDPANTLNSRSSEALDRLVKNPMIIVTDLLKDPKNVDATKNIHVLDEKMLSYGNKNTEDRVTSPTPLSSLITEAPIVTDEPKTMKSLNNQVAGGSFDGKSSEDKEESGKSTKEKGTPVQETYNLDELFATAFAGLEV